MFHRKLLVVVTFSLFSAASFVLPIESWSFQAPASLRSFESNPEDLTLAPAEVQFEEDRPVDSPVNAMDDGNDPLESAPDLASDEAEVDTDLEGSSDGLSDGPSSDDLASMIGDNKSFGRTARVDTATILPCAPAPVAASIVTDGEACPVSLFSRPTESPTTDIHFSSEDYPPAGDDPYGFGPMGMAGFEDPTMSDLSSESGEDSWVDTAIDETDEGDLTDEDSIETTPMVLQATPMAPITTSTGQIRLEAADSEGESVTYSWTLVSGPGSEEDWLTDDGQERLYYARVSGTYSFQLTLVDQSTNQTDSEIVDVDVKAPGPVSVGGPDKSVDLPLQSELPVHLDGQRSYSPDGESLSYQWQLLSGPSSITFEVDALPVLDLVVAPGAWVSGEYVFELTVTDSTGTDTDQVVLHVLEGELPAEAGTATLATHAGYDQLLDMGGQTAILVQSDGFIDGLTDEDTATWSWTQIAGPAAPPLSRESQTLQAVLAAPGTYEYRVEATLESGKTVRPSTVCLTVLAAGETGADLTADRA